MKNVKADLETVKLRQINFRQDLNKISKGNKNYKLKEQKKKEKEKEKVNNTKMLYDAQEKVTL